MHQLTAWIWSFVLAGFLVFGAANPAAAQDELHLSYEISLGGLSLAEADFNLIVRNGTYVARINYRTSGAVRLMSSGAGEAIVKGAYKGGRFIPATFDLDHRGGRRAQKVAIAIVDGKITAITLDPPIDSSTGVAAVDPDKLAGVVDPLSAMLVSGIAADAKPETRVCGRTLPIFDGIRRYDVELSSQSTGLSNRGIFIGPITTCQLRLTSPQADAKPGDAARWAERSGRLGSASVTFGLVAGPKVYVPVEILAEVGHVTLAVRLIRFSTGPAGIDAAR